MGGNNNLLLFAEQLYEQLQAFYGLSSNLLNDYQNISSELQQSYAASEVYWCNWAVENKRKISEDTGKTLSLIDEAVTDLSATEQQLCNVDKSYQKRRVSGFSDLPLGFSVDTDAASLLYRIQNICAEAKELANECATTYQHEVIQEIVMKFSKNRMAKYEKLYNLVNSARRIRQAAFDALLQEVVRQHDEIEVRKTDEISKALEETVSLIQETELQYIKKQAMINDEYIIKLENMDKTYNISRIIENTEGVGAEGDLPDSFRSLLLVGEILVDTIDIKGGHAISELIHSKLTSTVSENVMRLPFWTTITDGMNFCFSSKQTDKTNSNDCILSLLFTLLRNQPASKQHFSLIDPEGYSKGFELFLEFFKKHNDIIGSRILTTKNQIRQKLLDVCAFIDEVSQTRFVGFQNIFEYNEFVEDKQEPLKCVCILDFPSQFDESMLSDLYRIVRDGSKYGISVLIQYCNDQSEEMYSEKQRLLIDQIIAEMICLSFKQNTWVHSDKITVDFNRPPTTNDIRVFDELYSIEKNKMLNAFLPISKVLAESEWYTGNSAEMLSIPIGKNETGAIQALEFGDIVGNGTSHYALIVGSIGSGKSTLLHTIIMNSITKYSPDEVQLFLMDFKSGTEFKVYSDQNIPHIKLLALDAMQEFGNSILDKLWDILQDRSRIFKEQLRDNINIKDITQYRKITGKKMPRILVVIDEFQVLFSEDNNRQIANACGMRMADFISLARVYGIHFVLATQTLSRLTNGFSIKKSTLNEMHVRIGLQCTEYESGLLFGEINGKSAFSKMGYEKGTAAYVENDVRGVPVGFKVAFCDQETQHRTLRKVSQRYSIQEPKDKTIIFSADSVPLLINNTKFTNPDLDECFGTVSIYLGEPIKIAPPVTINVSRMRRNNLLVVGYNQKLLDRVVALYMINSVKTSPHKHKEVYNQSVYLIDGLNILGEGFSDEIRDAIEYSPSDIKIAKENSDVVMHINELYEIYQTRRKLKMEQQGSKLSFNTIHFVVNNLQWVEFMNLILSNKNVNEFVDYAVTSNKMENTPLIPSGHANDLTEYLDFVIIESAKDRTEKHISLHNKITTMMDNGYVYGINFVISSSDYQTIKPILIDVLPKFPNRIIFSMNNTDAYRIIPDANTEILRSNMALYSDGVHSTLQFKPYNINEKYQ